MKLLLFIINWTWCWPQNILGLLIFLWLKITKKVDVAEQIQGINYRKWSIKGGISLGSFIFVDYSAIETIKHEYGHTIQSYILGWFYLLVIGLPSIIWCWCFDKWRQKNNKSYYWFYTEKWANKLGKVNY